MQMYRVKFAHHKGDVVDTGDVVVVASSLEHAADVTCIILDLPQSSTVTEVTRVKPGLYQILRQDIPKPDMPTVATFPSAGEDDRHRYSVTASAFVKAHSEDGAIKKLAGAVLKEVSRQSPVSGPVGMLQIICERADLSPRPPAIERQSIYTHPLIFSGGDARTR